MFHISSIIELVKMKRKKICIILGCILGFSFYLGMIMKNAIVGLGFTVNPFKLLFRIPKYGFPGSQTLIVFFALLGLGLFMGYKARMDGVSEDERNFLYSSSGVYGTASLLQPTQLKGYAHITTSKKAEGTILGQLDDTGTKLISADMKSYLIPNRHVAVFGASGAGKSRCYARPFIVQAVKRRESVIVTDPKGELYESTAQYMLDNGYDVKIFDLVHPEKSDGWDCLKELRGDEIRAQIFSDVIIRNTGSGSMDSVWDTSAMALLKALVLRVERGHDFKESNNQSIGAAYELIQNPLGEAYLDEVFDVMSLSKEEQLCIGPYMTFKQGSPNLRGNIITGLATRLQVFQNEVIRQITAVDDIDLTAPATRPCAYYCIMSDQHSTLNFLSTLFFSFLFIDLVEYADMNGGQCPVPVNFLLDEFPNIGEIPDFAKKIATVRSRMINISIIFQGITQLMNRYKDNYLDILGNCAIHLFLGCNESATAEFISDRAGETTVKVKTQQHEKFESPFVIANKHSSGDGKRKIFNADEIMRFPKNKELIIFQGMNAMQAVKYDFSLHPESKKFKPLPIRDRPSIWDEEGRYEYRQQEQLYKEAYEKRAASQTATNDAEDDTPLNTVDNIKNIIKSKITKADESTNSEHEKNCDIEVKNADYCEYANDVVQADDIVFDDDNDESYVVDVSDNIVIEDIAINETEDTEEQISDATYETVEAYAPTDVDINQVVQTSNDIHQERKADVSSKPNTKMPKKPKGTLPPVANKGKNNVDDNGIPTDKAINRIFGNANEYGQKNSNAERKIPNMRK